MRSKTLSLKVARIAALGSTTTWIVLALLGGCGQTVVVGVDDTLSLGGGGAAGVSGSGGLALGGEAQSSVAGDASGGASLTECVKTLCRGRYYECGDCDDNDGDGQADSLDPECLGPCDDDETALSTGLNTGGGRPCWLDCYFDADAGPGNDKCEWSHQCDPLSLPPDYPPSGEARCAYGVQEQGKPLDCDALVVQPESCVAACLPIVPNGCDCFGCCELPARSGDYHFIGRGRGAAGCELSALDDPAACPPCTPVPSCFNACEPCEVCVGAGQDPACSTLPACAQGAACDPSAPCGVGEYCVTGCCVQAPVPR